MCRCIIRPLSNRILVYTSLKADWFSFDLLTTYYLRNNRWMVVMFAAGRTRVCNQESPCRPGLRQTAWPVSRRWGPVRGSRFSSRRLFALLQQAAGTWIRLAQANGQYASTDAWHVSCINININPIFLLSKLKPDMFQSLKRDGFNINGLITDHCTVRKSDVHIKKDCIKFDWKEYQTRKHCSHFHRVRDLLVGVRFWSSAVRRRSLSFWRSTRRIR